jgi:NAD(P)-dependent dehydrogenase (short-subunit alcohol dehydrogenase family)
MALALDLSGRVVLVTGGTRGIGLGIADAFRAAGATVVTCSRSEVEGATDHQVCDVRDPDAVTAMVESIVGTHGRLDVLVNNAGGAPSVDAATASPRFHDKVVGLNLLSPLLVSQVANAVMQRQEGGGSIVNISSVLGLRGASYAMAYCASKGAVRSLTKNVALHCAQMKYNIRCNSVHPGYIDTPMIAPRLDQNVGNLSGRQWLEELHPLGRLGRADEVANMILFLLSDESSFSTGSEFVCDGGLTA